MAWRGSSAALRRSTARPARARPWHFSCRAPARGKAALDLVDRGAPIDLMIIDYAMPGMNGAEVIARARALRPQLPIILITGYAEAGLAADLPEDVQLLRKPFRVSELLARVGSDIGAGARAERSNILPLRQ